MQFFLFAKADICLQSGIAGLKWFWVVGQTSLNIIDRRELSEADFRLINGRDSGSTNSGKIGTT